MPLLSFSLVRFDLAEKNNKSLWSVSSQRTLSPRPNKAGQPQSRTGTDDGAWVEIRFGEGEAVHVRRGGWSTAGMNSLLSTWKSFGLERRITTRGGSPLWGGGGWEQRMRGMERIPIRQIPRIRFYLGEAVHFDTPCGRSAGVRRGGVVNGWRADERMMAHGWKSALGRGGCPCGRGVVNGWGGDDGARVEKPSMNEELRINER
jgi:hypothetical protein